MMPYFATTFLRPYATSCYIMHDIVSTERSAALCVLRSALVVAVGPLGLGRREGPGPQVGAAGGGHVDLNSLRHNPFVREIRASARGRTWSRVGGLASRRTRSARSNACAR